jgi:hypothetical protein
MKNVTITLPPLTYERMRLAAARDNKSMSKYIAALIDEKFGKRMTAEEAANWLMNSPRIKVEGWAGKAPTTDELNS